MSGKKRMLVVFVDAFGPDQLDRVAEAWRFLPSHRTLEGVLGYTSGALPTILTGTTPDIHGRMCLFSQLRPGQPSILKPLQYLGLIPRIVHERRRVRQVAEKLLAKLAGLSGYVALHKVPPEHFKWLDLPERDDMFTAESVGGARTFLADARAAGLSVYSSPWQLPEPRRWEDIHMQLRAQKPDLAFLYAAELDAILHSEGNAGQRAPDAIRRIAQNIERARNVLAEDGDDVTTLVVGDHGMADIHRLVDPRQALAGVDTRVFVDATMIRAWGSAVQLDRLRSVLEKAQLPGTWFDQAALRDQRVPLVGSPYGDAMFVLDEGAMFAPSFLGGGAKGMHGYATATHSAHAALASDRELPSGVTSLAAVAPFVRAELGLV